MRQTVGQTVTHATGKGRKGTRRFFLPPIILQAGLGMRKKAFFANWQTIIATGILGTYIAFAIIAVMLLVFSRVLHVSLGVRSPPPPAFPLSSAPSGNRLFLEIRLKYDHLKKERNFLVSPEGVSIGAQGPKLLMGEY